MQMVYRPPSYGRLACIISQFHVNLQWPKTIRRGEPSLNARTGLRKTLGSTLQTKRRLVESMISPLFSSIVTTSNPLLYTFVTLFLACYNALGTSIVEKIMSRWLSTCIFSISRTLQKNIPNIANFPPARTLDAAKFSGRNLVFHYLFKL